jgi:ornithine cyclodeaminase/alanine dehydrogenase-like protein (mu-crystallin family)
VEVTGEADGLLHLSSADVEACQLRPAEIMEAVEEAFRGAAYGTAEMRPALSIPAEGRASFRAKAGVLRSAGFGAVKWYGYYPQNVAAGLPEYRPLILLNDTATGFPVALIDGELITTLRTAAISAVAAKWLAHPASARLGLVGLGTQARAHLRALRALFPITSVIAHGRRPETVAAFRDFARSEGVAEVQVAEDPRAALTEADIVITTVPRFAPNTGFLDAAWLSPGAFVSMVDSGVSWDSATLAHFSQVFSDDVAQSQGHVEAGDATAPFVVGLADVVGGTHAGRRDARERIGLLFSGTGLADAAAAVLVYRRALSRGIGRVLPH